MTSTFTFWFGQSWSSNQSRSLPSPPGVRVADSLTDAPGVSSGVARGVEASGFVDGQLDDALGAGGKADLTDDGAIAPSDDELDGRTHLGQLDIHVLEHARGDALSLAHEAEEQVLCSDVVVIEALRLILSEREDLASAVGELVEPIHRGSDDSGTGGPLRPSSHATTAPRDTGPRQTPDGAAASPVRHTRRRHAHRPVTGRGDAWRRTDVRYGAAAEPRRSRSRRAA